MKLLAVFLAALILGTGFDLCGELGFSGSKSPTELKKDADEHSGWETPCTPFCHCVRCNFSMMPDNGATVYMQELRKPKLLSSPETPPAGTFNKVWQPPQDPAIS